MVESKTQELTLNWAIGWDGKESLITEAQYRYVTKVIN